ncbi:MAG: XdhC family protein [Dehalococcoidia bacterium]
MNNEVLSALIPALESGERCAVATLVDARGSTPQKVGAALFVGADGRTAGTLGGGCVEAEAFEAARGAIASGETRLLDFALNEDLAVDYGLACGGTEVIFVDPTFSKTDLRLLEALTETQAEGGRAVLLTRTAAPAAGQRLAVWEDGRAIGGADADLRAIAERALRDDATPGLTSLASGEQVYVHPFEPSPSVVVVGAGYVGRAVATAAKFAGNRVVVIDDRPDFANRERFPDADEVIADDIEPAVARTRASRNTAIVIVTRGHKYDYQATAAALRTGAGYIGLMGSRRKVALIYRQLAADGVPAERLRDVHAPIGLDIGAVSPEEIAISIVAEITKHRLGGSGGSLRIDGAVTERAVRKRGRAGA